MLTLFYRISRKLQSELIKIISKYIALWHIRGNNITIGENPIFRGNLHIYVNPTGECNIGDKFVCNSGLNGNPIGRNTKTYLRVGSGAKLNIGCNVGISNTAIICDVSISIGNHVKIGGNTVIYDTDFHSLNHIQRRDKFLDTLYANKLPIEIHDDVFIGAHSTILKGVKIGKASIIAAGSVVTKSVPPGEIWGGNPAKYLRKVVS